MPRTTADEIADLTVRLMDGGLSETSARKEAERIAASITADALTIRRSNDLLRLDLPDRIGFVEIRTSGVHGPTGYPVIGVSLVSTRDLVPALDGLLYERIRDSNGDMLLVGKPSPKMLEEQRFMQRAAEIIKAHDSGEHAFCPDTCPAVIAADVPRETSEE